MFSKVKFFMSGVLFFIYAFAARANTACPHIRTTNGPPMRDSTTFSGNASAPKVKIAPSMKVKIVR